MIGLRSSDFGKTFSSSMWDEWVAGPAGDREEALEEVRGIVQGIGTAGKAGSGIRLTSGRLWIFRRLSRIWERAGLTDEEDFGSFLDIPKTLKGRVSLQLPKRLAFLTSESPRLSPSFDRENPRRLRGLWGSCGALYIPKSGYYLSFRIPAARADAWASAMLEMMHFSYGKRLVQGRHEITLRNQEEIVTLLVRFGLSRTSLKMEEKAILRSVKNRANMLVNCDSSNIRKTLEAASRQLELAREAVSSPRFESLPEVLKTLASSRVANPSATLAELGQLQSPPISKSTVQYRWKKLAHLMGPVKSRHLTGQKVKLKKEVEFQ